MDWQTIFRYLYGAAPDNSRYGELEDETADVLQVYGILRSDRLMNAAARRWDKETSDTQKENLYKAEEYNRVTQESFVASVVLASAMARAVIKCPRIVIVPYESDNDFNRALPDDADAFADEPRPNGLNDIPSHEDVVLHYVQQYALAEAARSEDAALYVNAFRTLMQEDTFASLNAALAAMDGRERPERDATQPTYSQDGHISLNSSDYMRYSRGNFIFANAPQAPAPGDPERVADFFMGGSRAQIQGTLEKLRSGIKGLADDSRAPDGRRERSYNGVTLGEACLAFAALR